MKCRNDEPTQEALRDLFDYDASRGVLIYRRSVPQKKRGSIAGCKHHSGYQFVGIKYRLYMLHRLIWAWHYGAIPVGYEIDHLDHDKTNNRIENLRLATRMENARNMPLYSKSKSGCHGVRWREKYSTWEVSIRSNGALIYLGCFRNLLTAISVRKAAERALGYHHNHSKKRAAGRPSLFTPLSAPSTGTIHRSSSALR